MRAFVCYGRLFFVLYECALSYVSQTYKYEQASPNLTFLRSISFCSRLPPPPSFFSFFLLSPLLPLFAPFRPILFSTSLIPLPPFRQNISSCETAGLLSWSFFFKMAPNFMKVKVFGSRRTFQQPEPLNTDDPDFQGDIEAGSFLNDPQSSEGTAHEVSNSGSHRQGDNPYLDEYRA